MSAAPKPESSRMSYWRWCGAVVAYVLGAVALAATDGSWLGSLIGLPLLALACLLVTVDLWKEMGKPGFWDA